jgi:hypothetical protein
MHGLVVQYKWTNCKLTVDDFQSAGFAPGNEAHTTEVERLVKRIALDAHVKLSERCGDIQAFVDSWSRIFGRAQSLHSGNPRFSLILIDEEWCTSLV